jgi:hypothetical protein
MSVDRVSAWDEIRQEEEAALGAVFGMIAGPSGFVQLDRYEVADDRTVGEWRPCWIPCDDLARWNHHAVWFAERFDTRVQVAPRTSKDPEGLMRCSVLWALTDSREAAARLGRFNPRPTLVLRVGETAQLTALWALDRPLAWDWSVRATRRIAHALRAPKKWCRPDIAIRVPGSAVRQHPDGQMRITPARVNVEAFEPRAIYTARRVVGHLPEAPDPNGWRERRGA